MLFPLLAGAQIQQAWVERYDNGFPEGTNQVVKMALDSLGNICVTGLSENVATNLGYATIKYAPNGSTLWQARYDSTNFPAAVPAVLVLDISNNVFVTGSALTVKYDSNGNQLWTAPYAGTSMGIDTNGNVALTGFGSLTEAVKLSPAGSNLWTQTFPSSYWSASITRGLAVDSAGNTYVAGEYQNGPDDFVDIELHLIKYDPSGNQVWTGAERGNLDTVPFTIMTMTVDLYGNVWIAANFSDAVPGSMKFGGGGTLLWANSNPDANCGDEDPHVLALDAGGNAVVTGSSCYVSNIYTFATTVYGTYKADTNGDWQWTNNYPVMPASPSVHSGAYAIAIDSFGNSYVTGYSFTGSTTGIVTIAYGPNGNQLWLQTYAAPSGGNAVGNAIAVDNAGNVYVAGYEDTGAGGTEFVLIKYSPVKLQKTSNGSMLLQALGSPGEIFTIEASQNLTNWFGIGTATADTNGLMQFTDTNAPNYTARFYNTIPQ